MSYVVWFVVVLAVLAGFAYVDRRRKRRHAERLAAKRAVRVAEIEAEHGPDVAAVWDAETELRLAAIRVGRDAS